MKAYNDIKITTCSEMRQIDAEAIKMGIPGIVLMENAALAVVSAVMEHNPRRVLIFCGKGQNGGDGFAVARHLVNKGVNTRVVMLCSDEEIKGDAQTNLAVLRNMGGDIVPFSAFDREPCDVIVDALLGTGIKGNTEGDFVSAIEYINQSDAAVISVDIPSGINGDSGVVCGCAVKADVTVTFAYPKLGLYSDLSKDYIGRLVISDISIPENLPCLTNINTYVITEKMAKTAFPKKSRAAHKGSMGRVYIVGGSRGMAGAVLMAAGAAERGGAGLVTCIVPEEILDSVMSNLVGCMCAPLSSELCFDAADAILIGNGMGNTEITRKYVSCLLQNYKGTLVIDADGLNVLGGAEQIKNTDAKIIITPHVGEMSRLTRLPVQEIIADKAAVAREFAQKSGAVVVLKGANTVVATPQGKTYINNRGTPAMAKGGSGDILAGLITAVAAKGTPPEAAACAGVFVHAVAGELAEKESGEYSVLPDEIINNIGKAISEL